MTMIVVSEVGVFMRISKQEDTHIDILNNTLEQTKRDLNREVQKGGSDSHKRNAKSSSSKLFSWPLLLLLALTSLLSGIKLQQMDKTGFVSYIPVVKKYFNNNTILKENKQVEVVKTTGSADDGDDEDYVDDEEL